MRSPGALPGLLCVLSILGSASGFPVLLGSSDVWLYSIQDIARCSDGGYALTVCEVMEDPTVIWLGPCGELVDERPFSSVGRRLESGGWLLPRREGGLYLCCFSEPRATGMDADIALFGISADGEQQWVHQIGREEDDGVYIGLGAVLSSDGGCAVLGLPGFYSGRPGFLRLISPAGEMEWELALQMEGDDETFFPVALGRSGDGFLVLMKHAWREVVLMVRVGRDGRLDWASECPVPCSYGPSAFRDHDGLVDFYYSVDDHSGVLGRIDSDGVILRTAIVEHPIRSVADVELADEGLFLTGSESHDDDESAVLVCLGRGMDGSGSWSFVLDTPGRDRFTGVLPLEPCGFLLTGYSGDIGADDGSLFVLEVDSSGCPEGPAGLSEVPEPSLVLRVEELSLGWVVACGVYQSEAEAYERALSVREAVNLGRAGVLWIPDWPSLSGFEGWLAYIECLGPDEIPADAADLILDVCPDAYVVWVGRGEGRRMSLGHL